MEYAYAINNVGQVVGESTGGGSRALLWSNGTTIDLTANLPSSNSMYRPQSVAYDINDSGFIVGKFQSYDVTGPYSAFVWNYGNITNLGLGEAIAVNNSIQIVGQNIFGRIWNNGVGSYFGTDSTDWIQDINNAGYIVGSNQHQASEWHNSSMSFLSTPANITGSVAWAINNSGDIVGQISDSAWTHASIWSNGAVADLNSFAGGTGWELNAAYDINDKGQIVGEGQIDGHTHAFLMTPESTPVPEPSTVLLLAVGIGGIVLWSKRRL